MIKFIKNLLGFGPADAYKPQETVKEILTPPVVTDSKTTEATYIAPAKPRHRAGTVAEVKLPPLAPATATPAKKRKPYYGKKKPAAKPKVPATTK